MKRKPEIEAAVHRSLEQRIRVRQLDAGFNASVWARIAAQEAASTPAPLASRRASRWLLASNVAGIAVSIGLIVYFCLRLFAGVEVEPLLTTPSAEDMAGLVQWLLWGSTALSLGVGLAFTPLGRRLRDEFS